MQHILIVDLFTLILMERNRRPQVIKADRSKMTIFYLFLILTNTMQIYSLAILMKYVLKENKLPEFWVD